MGKRKSRKGRAAKNAQKSINDSEPETLVKAPHSFVIYRGRLGRNASELLFDFRKVMEPYTATKLKVQKRNVVKDFVGIAGPLNVTHLAIFTKSEIAMYLRLARLPRGPTLTFRIHNYSLARDVISSLRKPVTYDKLFNHHPLLVLNNFSGERLHFKLLTSMFQSMFPSINIHQTKLNSIRRCVLLSYNSEDKTIDFRHYAIKVVPTGISKAVKKLIQSKVPDLGQYEDASEFIMKSGNLSESEVELDNANEVTLPQPISSRGNMTSQKSAIRLFELGPRLTLQLIKIEEGLMDGEVIHHELVEKTPEEVEALRVQKEKKRRLKEYRKKEQQKNIEKKEIEKAKLRDKSISFQSKDVSEAKEATDEEEENEKWFIKEVGEKPDRDLFPRSKKRKLESSSGQLAPRKKQHLDSSYDKETGPKKTKTFQDLLARRKKRKQEKLTKQKRNRKPSKSLPIRSKNRSKHTRRKR